MNDDIQVHPGGPYLQAAFLCERILTEADGTNSYIRVIDRFARQSIGPNRPDESVPHVISFTVVAMIRAGRSEGPVELQVRPQLPSGEQGPPQVLSFSLRPGGAINVHIPVQMETLEQGVYCIQLLLNGLLASEVPFTVEHGFFSIGTPQAPSPE